jgi:transcriptional regulator with XRE-family HTH domain
VGDAEERTVAGAAPGFGALLRAARLAAGLSQEALAEAAGLSARAVSDLERVVNRAPRGDTLEALARALRLAPAARAEWRAAWRAAREGAAPRPTPPAGGLRAPDQPTGPETIIYTQVEEYNQQPAEHPGLDPAPGGAPGGDDGSSGPPRRSPA